MNEDKKDFVEQELDSKDTKYMGACPSEKIAEITDTENISVIGKNIKVNEMDGLLF